MMMEESLTGNTKFAELLEECDRHIHQNPAFPTEENRPSLESNGMQKP